MLDQVAVHATRCNFIKRVLSRLSYALIYVRESKKGPLYSHNSSILWVSSGRIADRNK